MGKIVVLLLFTTIICLASNASLASRFLRKGMSMVSSKSGKCQCGKSVRGKMATFWSQNSTNPSSVKLDWSKTLGDKKVKKIIYDVEALGKGTSSSAYHAELEMQDQKNKNDVEYRCVALKQTLGRNDWVVENTVREWKLLEAFDEISDQRKRRHVVNQLASGEYQAQDGRYLLTILELGAGDYDKHLEEKFMELRQHKKALTEEMIAAEIWQVVLATRDMHQKLMHLDFKPANLIFMKDNGEKILKAIDFGHSEFIGKSVVWRSSKWRANKEVKVGGPKGTPIYVGIEQREQEQEIEDREREDNRMGRRPAEKEPTMVLTTKVDIWAIGIMIYEIMLMDEHQTDIYDVLDTFAEFHMIRKDGTKMFKKWNWDHELGREGMLGQLWELIKVQMKYPRISFLVQAILDHDPKMRPTATGILHFLKGTCRLGNKDLEKNFMEKLLPSLSFSQLIGHLEMRQAPRDLIKVVEEMVEQRRVYAFNWDPKLSDCDTDISAVRTVDIGIRMDDDNEDTFVAPDYTLTVTRAAEASRQSQQQQQRASTRTRHHHHQQQHHSTAVKVTPKYGDDQQYHHQRPSPAVYATPKYSYSEHEQQKQQQQQTVYAVPPIRTSALPAMSFVETANLYSRHHDALGCEYCDAMHQRGGMQAVAKCCADKAQCKMSPYGGCKPEQAGFYPGWQPHHDTLSYQHQESWLQPHQENGENLSHPWDDWRNRM